MIRSTTMMLFLGASVALASCLAPIDDDANNDGLVYPDLKSDTVAGLTELGALQFSQPVVGQFTQDHQLFGYELGIAAGAKARLEITKSGTTRALDTVLFVYGPKTASGYPSEPLAVDNDSGWGKFSRLDATTVQAGTYLVVVGTRTGTGTSSRGKYRLLATCKSGDASACAWTAPVEVPLGECPAALKGAIDGCVQGHLADEFYGSVLDLIDQCADAEILASAYDSACTGGGAPSWCLGSLEATYLSYAQPCARDVKNDHLDQTCALGATYYEMSRQPNLVQLRKGLITSAAGLSTIEKNQIISALHASSHTDVTTAAEAIAAADQGEINRIFWWDASNRQTYVSFEYGAGDNSYGRIFYYGTTNAVASIHDGDLEGCNALMGDELRACTGAIDCREGLACTGIAQENGIGACIATSQDNAPQEGASCSATSFCPFASGLVCAGLSRGAEGMCLPAWMRKTVAGTFDAPIPDKNATGASATLLVNGIATVDMDVWLAVEITHPRRTDLKVYLKNPAGTEVLVAAPTEPGSDLWIDVPVLGFSGDEQVNGAWTVRVVDGKAGQKGTLNNARLTVGSRWD